MTQKKQVLCSLQGIFLLFNCQTPGDAVQAGELLGYMGDSGYGPEGTTGEFPVHLHLGIYLPLGADQEKAVNPYWMLRYLESRKLTYAY